MCIVTLLLVGRLWPTILDKMPERSFEVSNFLVRSHHPIFSKAAVSFQKNVEGVQRAAALGLGFI
jgi:hypothetical protein